mgnify:CR=1 FL=1
MIPINHPRIKAVDKFAIIKKKFRLNNILVCFSFTFIHVLYLFCLIPQQTYSDMMYYNQINQGSWYKHPNSSSSTRETANSQLWVDLCSLVCLDSSIDILCRYLWASFFNSFCYSVYNLQEYIAKKPIILDCLINVFTSGLFVKTIFWKIPSPRLSILFQKILSIWAIMLC